MYIHTNIAESSESVPKDECLISPIVQVVSENLKNNELKQNTGLYTVNIPHCLQDTSMSHKVKVHHLSSKIQPHGKEEFARAAEQPQHGTFDIHKQSISIYTNNFSTFVCTSCGNLCQSSIFSLMFARLTPLIEAQKTTVDMKIFLGSPLFSIQEFRNVSKLINAVDVNVLFERII